MDNLTRGG